LISCYPDTRPLPSFPTRRSSDLGVGQEAFEPFAIDLIGQAAEAPAVGIGLGAERRSDEKESFDTLGAGAREQKCGCRSHRLASQDRKSTRLNSSHGSISYAVFCL